MDENVYSDEIFLEIYRRTSDKDIQIYLPDVYKKIQEFVSLSLNNVYKKTQVFDKKRQSNHFKHGNWYKGYKDDSDGGGSYPMRNGSNLSKSQKDNFSNSNNILNSHYGIIFRKRRIKIESDISDNYEGMVNEISLIMNKITKVTYDKLYAKIYEIVKNDSRMIHECLTKLFKLVGLNSALLDLYTIMFIELNKTFKSECMEAIEAYIHNYIITIDDIVNINPHDDYDAYCIQCKKNDTRRHLSKFFGCLRINCGMDSKSIVYIIDKMYDMFMRFLTLNDHKSHVNEVIDNIYILINGCMDEDFLKFNMSGIFTISEQSYDTSSDLYPSITSKSIFKCRDITEKIKLKRVI